jgi:hypothetical protein
VRTIIKGFNLSLVLIVEVLTVYCGILFLAKQKDGMGGVSNTGRNLLVAGGNN